MLSAKTKKRLINALLKKSLADEMESKLSSPGAISKGLKRAIEVALANKKAALDLIAALESGPASLKLDTKRRIIQEMANKSAGEEIISQAQS